MMQSRPHPQGPAHRLRAATLALWALSLLADAGHAAAPGAESIAQLLTSASGWTVFIETTPDARPSDRATRAGYAFFRRGPDVVGRTTALAEGFNCEFKVRVRDDGVDLHPRSRACSDRYGDDAPYTRLVFDPADSTYPLKRVDVPQKWWLSPQR